MDDTTQINLTPPDTEADKINVALGQQPQQNSPEVAEIQGAKAHFGLGQTLNQSLEETYNGVLKDEPGYRGFAAATVNYNRVQDQKKLISQVAEQYPDAETLARDKVMMSKITGVPPEIDPRSVIEEYTAGKYLAPYMDLSRPWVSGSFMNDAMRIQPEQTQEDFDTGHKIIDYIEYAKSKALQAEQKLKEQSYLGRGVDFLKMMWQPYMEAKLRGLSDAKWYDGFFGTQLNEARIALYDKGYEGFKNEVDRIGSKLESDNPALAVFWYNAVSGLSRSEIAGLNLQTPMMVLDAEGFAKGGISLLKALALRNATRTAVRDAAVGALEADGRTPVQRFNDAVKSWKGRVSDIPQTTVPTEVSKNINVTASEALGDLEEAATQKLKFNIYQKSQGTNNVLNELTEALPTGMKLDAPDIRANPSTVGGRELANRTADRLTRQDVEFNDALQNIWRIMPAPALEASENLARLAVQEQAGKYAGANSTLLDWGNITLEPKSNTLHYPIAIGHQDGRLFLSPEEALGQADLHEWPMQRPETTLVKQMEDKLVTLTKRIHDGQGELGKAPAMDAGTEDLNRWYDKEKALNGLKAEWQVTKNVLGHLYVNPKDNVAIPASKGYELKPHITQQGTGYYLEAWVPLQMTHDSVRSKLLQYPEKYAGPVQSLKAFFTGKGATKRQGTMMPWIEDPATGQPSQRLRDLITNFGPTENINLTRIRSPEETLSPAENDARKITTFGPSKLLELFQEDAKIIGSLNKREADGLNRLMLKNQPALDPITKRPGVSYRSPLEFETEYRRLIDRNGPTEKQVEAYFAYTSSIAREHALMTLGTLRNKWRNGVVSNTVSTVNSEGRVLKSAKFDGTLMDSLPTNGTTFINYGHKGTEKIVDAGKMGPKIAKQVQKDFEEGKVKVIRVWDTDLPTLRDFSDKIKPGSRIEYVITGNSEHTFEPINFRDQIPRLGGGHLIPNYEWYMKIAKMVTDPVTGITHYIGDATAMPFRNHALGQRVAEHLTNISRMLAVNDENGARAMHGGAFGMNFDRDILRRFTAQGVNPADWTPGQKFYMVPRDRTLMDIPNTIREDVEAAGGKFRDGTTHGNPARSNQIRFTQHRDAYDLHTIEDTGTIRNPNYQYRPIEDFQGFLDPIDSMNRGITSIVNSLFMDEYRYMAVEHWLQTAIERNAFDDGVKIADVRRAPYWAFADAPLKSALDPMVRNVLESNRQKIRDFISTPSAVDAALNDLTTKLADSIYNKGPLGLKALGGGKGAILPLAAIPYTKNPLQAIRSLTVHAKLGLFSIPQMFVQGTAVSNVFAISPRSAAAAGIGTLLFEWSRFVSPQMMETLDKYATRLVMPGFHQWQPGWWKEAAEILHTRTGFSKVAGEHAVADSALTTNPISNWTDFIKYWGQTAFREGAQTVRMSAWFTAYMEWRQANPTKVMSRIDRDSIIGRASDLDHNMSRASNSALNSGVMSWPGMFYTYARNLSEMFYGKRLTVGEKARLFAVNSLLWGAPAGGIGLAGFPVGDWIRKKAEEAGYRAGDGYWSYVMEGLPAAITAMITGKGDMSKGNWYNFSRFGVKGYDPLLDLADNDKTIYDIIGGAPYSLVANSWKHSSGFRHAMWDLITLNPNRYQFTGADFADLFKEAASFSYGWKAYMAVTTGAWLSNNDTVLQNNISSSDAIWRALTGTTDVRISDVGVVRAIDGDRKEFLNKATSLYAKNYHRALLALQNGDTTQHENYMKQAMLWLMQQDLTSANRAKIIHEINQQNLPLIDKLNRDLSFKNVPESEAGTQLERYQRSLESK